MILCLFCYIKYDRDGDHYCMDMKILNYPLIFFKNKITN